jgi:glycosyltransferase involved in cell wall biosynthesis
VANVSDLSGFRIVHAIAQLRFGAGRYVVDTAIAQHRREPGRVAVAISQDAEAPWVSTPALVGELGAAGVPVFTAGDFFHRDAATLKLAAAALRQQVLRGAPRWAATSVVHAHTAMAAAAARWAGAPRVVLTCHGWGSGRPADVDLQDALAYSVCDVVTSPSEGWAAVVRERTSRDFVPVVAYGFDLTRLSLGPHAARPGPVRIVSVGELSYRKGADVLLEAMASVWSHVPDAQLHFIGGGELEATLRARAEALGGATRVVFHGHMAHPSAILGGFDVFALATRSDNQPVAIVEAMAAGLPVVSTRVGGITEMIERAQCGFLVPPGHVADLSAVLRVLADASPLVRADLGRAGVAYVRAHHDVVAHVEALEVLYGAASPRGALTRVETAA